MDNPETLAVLDMQDTSIYVPVCEVIVSTRTKYLGSNYILYVYVIFINDNYK
jgi:hypothetical protein